MGIRRYWKSGLILVLMAFIMMGCRETPEPRIDNEPRQLTIIYAVNNNNLASDLINNESQMLEAMGAIDANKYKLLVYKYTSEAPGLYEVVNNNGVKEFSLIKSYDKSVMSIDKSRIAEVLEDALSRYPDLESNLFFWGHGMGWVNPNKYTNTVVATSAGVSGVNASADSNYLVNFENSVGSISQGEVEIEVPEVYGFGGEYTDETKRKTDYIDLDMLADAIPDGKFDVIWFDCCYMSSVEVAYQLRNKCRYMVAYPTEIMAEGLPYNLVLPYVIGEKRNLLTAANALYEYYTGKTVPEPVTVAVLDMSKIDGVAQAAKQIFSTGITRPATSGMQNYSRLYNTPYYDFGQYLREYLKCQTNIDTNGTLYGQLLNSLSNSIDEFVVYSAASDKDFNYPTAKPINKDNFTGLSIHPYMGVNTLREEYYRKLDWYKRVWED